MTPLCSECLHFVKISTFPGFICISWKYPRSVDIIHVHTAAVGHVTSTINSTLSTAPYCPLYYCTTHCINSAPSKSIHFSGLPSLSRILALAYGSPDSQDSHPYTCILPTSRDLSMTSLHLTGISGLLDVSLVLPDSQYFFNT